MKLNFEDKVDLPTVTVVLQMPRSSLITQCKVTMADISEIESALLQATFAVKDAIKNAND